MMDLQRVNEYMSQVEESEKKVLPHGKRLKTGLDLGTAFIVLVVLDENDQPVACEKQAASVLRDGVVVDYSGACRIVRELKEKLEKLKDSFSKNELEKIISELGFDNEYNYY